ncbi:hypothetical protein PF001_g10087 [Phytophthora fragariae]|uniref:Uncharacterized protein n=1 Tax=Phytophthora fragariae TaxID=53985 RepID=A0A6A4E0T8_9STRA|nr:hypothetical protein PF001_g10087 [Phytophthora fragariae]
MGSTLAAALAAPEHTGVSTQCAIKVSRKVNAALLAFLSK